MLSADPITGIFDDGVNAELALANDSAQASQELAVALERLAQTEEEPSPVVTAHADGKGYRVDYVKTVQEQGLLISTADDVDAAIGEAGGSGSWTEGDAVSATSMSFAPSGSETARFDVQFDLSKFMLDETAGINAIHFVDNDVSVGLYDLEAGDIVFSVDGTAALLNSDGSWFTGKRGDVLAFRPDTVGDYTAGTFSMVVEQIAGSNDDLQALTVVEQTTTVAGNTLNPGDILFVSSDKDYDEAIYRYYYTDILVLTTPSTAAIIEEGDTEEDDFGWNLNLAGINGLELLETEQTVGGVTFSAGTLLVASDGDEAVLSLSFSGSSTDLELADATITSQLSYATALEGVTSIDALSVAPYVVDVNAEPTGSLVIEGVATEDETLTAISSLSDEDGMGGASFQWFRDGVAIAGATGQTYTLGDADVGSQMTVRISYTDGGGTNEQVTSAATAAVANINDGPAGSIFISGDLVENEQLSIDISGLTDDDGFNPGTSTVTYQWLRDNSVISGADSDSYTLGDDDVGAILSFVIRYIDDNGTTETVRANALVEVANINDAPTGSVNIAGSAKEDKTLTAITSSIADGDGLGDFNYQWLRNGTAITGAQAETYTLGDDDVGSTISVRVSYTDNNGTLEQITSSAKGPINNVNDAPQGQPWVFGQIREDATISAFLGWMSDADGPGSNYQYQWLRDGQAIAGATAITYTLGDDDVGSIIQVRVSYTDGQGTDETVTSSNSGFYRVANVNDAPTGEVGLLGSSIAGQTLTMDLSELADIDGLGSFNYQWLRNGEIIDGATGVGYILTSSDIGAVVQGQVLYTDGHGTLETVTSQASEQVADNIGHGTATVTIAGNAAEYETLTAVATLLDEDGTEEEPSAIRYQWFRDDIAIDGAVNSTYQLIQADIGGRFSVLVELDHHHIDASSVLSDATAVVINTNDLPQGQLIISGLAQEYQTLEVSTSGITDGDGLGDFNRQWLRNGVAIAGATGTQYTLTADDIGSSLSVQITYRDGYGTAERVVSLATDEVANVNDPLLGELAIAGQMIEGQTLNAVTDTLADGDGLGDLQYQWLRNGQAIEGATGNNYRLGQDDVGSNIALRVQYTDGFGTVESVSAAGTSAVQNINDNADGAVVIRGNNLVGESLTADTSNVTDRDGLGSFQYQWLRDGEVIAGATEQDYRLLQSDLDAEISIQVTYVDGFGQQEQVGSNKVVVEVLRLEAEAVAEANEPEPATKAPEQVVEAEPEADSGEGEEESSTEQVDGNGQQTTSVKMDVSASVAAVESIQGVDFTNSALSGLATNFGDSTNTDDDAGDGGVNLLKNDSLLAESFGIELASETVANLDQFLDPLELVTNVAVNDSFDQLRQQFMDMTGQEQMLWSGGTTTLTASFSVGYVVWLLRSGVLLSTALSAIPAWRFIDPLPVLMSSASAAGDGDDESLESMVSQGDSEQEAGVESNDKESH
ncbi:hypothetical protein GCM10025791_32860 [Halioxenophilus aromaticivorans]|uniref:Cadherin domain-containing protein n=1 Tax=Halioxenophilus aromaticivorans TaxID=1306992 RepID=A0AAV3U5K9_9ALTE